MAAKFEVNKDPRVRHPHAEPRVQSRALAAVVSLVIACLLLTGCKSSTTAGAPVNTAVAAVTSVSTAAPVVSSGADSCPATNTTSFAKTKFVLHAGLAFGAFHRYIYTPLTAGTFKSGAQGRLTAIVKAGAAALFIKREVRLTYEDATANPTLCKAIAAPLQSVGDTIAAAVTKLKGGDSSGVTAVEKNVQSVESGSAGTGTTIQEDPNAPLS